MLLVYVYVCPNSQLYGIYILCIWKKSVFFEAIWKAFFAFFTKKKNYVPTNLWMDLTNLWMILTNLHTNLTNPQNLQQILKITISEFWFFWLEWSWSKIKRTHSTTNQLQSQVSRHLRTKEKKKTKTLYRTQFNTLHVISAYNTL